MAAKASDADHGSASRFKVAMGLAAWRSPPPKTTSPGTRDRRQPRHRFGSGAFAMTDPRIHDRFRSGRNPPWWNLRWGREKGMREIVFKVTDERPGRLVATAPEQGLVVEAASLEELHHEARDVLIRQVGSAHATYRIRIRPAGLAWSARSSSPEDQPTPRHPCRRERPLPAGMAGCEPQEEAKG